MKSSVTTRLLYFTFLFFVLIVCSIMLSPAVGTALQNVVSQNVFTKIPLVELVWVVCVFV